MSTKYKHNLADIAIMMVKAQKKRTIRDVRSLYELLNNYKCYV